MHRHRTCCFLQVEGFLDELEPVEAASRVSLVSNGLCISLLDVLRPAANPETLAPSNSMQVTLSQDVQWMRKGIDLILYEREKQQNNFIIYNFYLNAVHKGESVF